MNSEIDFSKQYEHEVEIYLDGYGTLGTGILHFGGGNFPRINLDPARGFIRPDGEPHLKAKTKTGETFTLTNCTYQEYTIHSSMMVGGGIISNINEIVVKYADISDWFMHDQYVKGSPGDNLTWSSPPPQILASIENEGDRFSLKSEIYSSISKHREERTIHEHVNFIFTKSDGEFSLSDIKNKPLELSGLLSILIAYPISISNIWIKSESNYSAPLYYPAFKKYGRDFDEGAFWRNALIFRSTIDGSWQTIFERYYNSSFRKTQWVRLAGMQRHEGFWEYKVLGYVSLLDGYASKLTKENNIRPSNDKIEKIDAALEALNAIRNPPTSEQLADIRPIIESALPKRRTLSLIDKYNYLIENTDTDVIKIINLSNDDFKQIKEIRDTIAHGDNVDLVKHPYEKIHSITQRLALLLTHHALVDFGITVETFTKSLFGTLNELRYDKELNSIHLQRMVEPDSFLQVSQSLFDKISSTASLKLHACFVETPDRVLDYSEKYSQIYRDWRNKKLTRQNSFEDIFNISKERIRSIDMAYFECAGETKELYGVLIISNK
ncbi:hypothetical protein HX866_06460 [Pseudomonas gingeri]|uniref:ApeA N-terminal domain 1-containing protein n=1 Tax=Pseudomonas gingeri TaxID=117681 RepID=UPI0015A3EEC2|nr:HEPN domain-containing protein [Pseudomonas gingeri]NWA24527.1 hypothetical protein [Pseudomonas gingeri]